MAELTVFYDELCVLCSTEINHYKKLKGSERIRFIDINSPEFEPAKFGVDPYQAHKVMHATLSDGRVVTRVEAFVEIWKRIPKYRWLYQASQIKASRFLMDQGYIVFAFMRPYLPKRKKDLCAASPYCDIHQKNEGPHA